MGAAPESDLLHPLNERIDVAQPRRQLSSAYFFSHLCISPAKKKFTSSFFSSTDRTSFSVSLTPRFPLCPSADWTDRSPLLSDGIRRAAPSGTTRLGEETDGGIPRVSSAGKARLAGVGRGVAVSRLDDLLGVRGMGVGAGPDALDAEGGVERLRGFAA